MRQIVDNSRVDDLNRSEENSSTHYKVPWRVSGRVAPTWRPPFSRTVLQSASNGMNSTLYRHLGAHVDHGEGLAGTKFAVWAPNARDVSVVCDSNSWTHGRNPLKSSDSGVWWGFLPEIGHGAAYKFSIRTRSGQLLQKA